MNGELPNENVFALKTRLNGKRMEKGVLPAIEFLLEIQRQEEAARRTKSKTLKRDYLKSASRKRKELSAYCKSFGIDVDKLEGMIGRK